MATHTSQPTDTLDDEESVPATQDAYAQVIVPETPEPGHARRTTWCGSVQKQVPSPAPSPPAEAPVALSPAPSPLALAPASLPSSPHGSSLWKSQGASAQEEDCISSVEMWPSSQGWSGWRTSCIGMSPPSHPCTTHTPVRTHTPVPTHTPVLHPHAHPCTGGVTHSWFAHNT